MLYPGTFGISVWNGRAAVVRYERAEGGITWQTARNWEDLEPQALQAVENQGGWRTASGHYACPPDLAQQAVFGEKGEGESVS